MIESGEIMAGLRSLGIDGRDTLFVHAGMQSALRVAGAGREEKMDTVLAALEGAVDGGTLMLPTFTYSFCEGADFDVADSPSTVGMLTERFRVRDGVRRTREPLFSVAVRGPAPERLFAVSDVECFGEDSVFAHLHAVDAKLLFVGVGFGFCTYLHFLEQRFRVPYRYLKPFTGTVIDGQARHRVTARYFVRRRRAGVVNDFDPLARELLERDLFTEHHIERGPRLLCCGARAVHDVARELVTADPDYLVAGAPAL